MQTIKIKSNKREEMIEITSKVEKLLRESDAKEGRARSDFARL